MSKFRPGDKVSVKYFWLVGSEFEVASVDGDLIRVVGRDDDFYANMFKLVDRPFTQENLEIGMLVKYKYGDIYNVNSEPSARIARKAKNVVAIYKPTETGFDRVWTKPEPKLYTLELPNNNSIDRFYNRYTDKHYRFSIDVERNGYRTQFTLEEIDNLPNQDLIKALIKKEVVE